MFASGTDLLTVHAGRGTRLSTMSGRLGEEKSAKQAIRRETGRVGLSGGNRHAQLR